MPRSIFGCVAADPKALNTPPNDHVLNAQEVIVSVVRINRQLLPEEALQRAVREFAELLTGQLRFIDDGEVHVGNRLDGAIGAEELEGLIRERRNRGPCAISIIAVPDLMDPPSRFPPRWAGVCLKQDDHGYVLLLSGRRLDREYGHWRLVVPSSTRWHRVIKHELLHTLDLPYERSRVCNLRGKHCTNPACILYGRPGDVRKVVASIVRLGPPAHLCGQCTNELRSARRPAGAVLVGPEEPYDKIRLLDRIVELNPDRSLAYAYRADEYRKREDYQRALNDLDSAVSLNPRDPMEYMYRAQVLVDLERHEDAIADYTTALSLDPGPKTSQCLRNRARLLQHIGRDAESVEDLRQCLAINPEDREAAMMLERLHTAPQG